MLKTLLYLVFFIEIGGLGFINPHTTFAIYTSFGKFQIGLILLIVIYITIFLSNRKVLKLYRNWIYLLVLVLHILIIFQFTRGYISGVSLRTLFYALLIQKMFFYFIPFVVVIKTETEINRFINYMLVLGILSSVIALVQFNYGFWMPSSGVRYFGYGFYRVYHPGALLIAFSILYIEAKLLLDDRNSRKFYLYVILTLLSAGLITTFHRNLFVGVVLSSSVLYFYASRISNNIKNNISLILKILFTSGTVIVATYILLEYTGLGVSVIVDRFSSGVDDITNTSGTFNTRIEILMNAIDELRSISLLLGNGFNIAYNPSSALFLTYDNTFANIFILYGYLGIILFSLLLISYLSTVVKLFVRTINNIIKISLLTTMSTMICIVISSFFSANIVYSPNLSIFVVLMGIIFFYQNKQQMISQANKIY